MFLCNLLDAGVYSTFFARLLDNFIQPGSAFHSVCLGIACLAVGINLIRIMIAMGSDDSNGGFAGITLRDIVRPLIFILLILIYSKVFVVFNGFVDNVTSSIANAIDHPSTTSYEEVIDRVHNAQYSIAQAAFSDEDRASSFVNNPANHRGGNVDGKFKRSQINSIADELYVKNGIEQNVEDANNELNQLAKQHGYTGGGMFSSAKSYLGNLNVSSGAALDDKTAMTPEERKKYDDLMETIKYGEDYRKMVREQWRDLEKQSTKSKETWFDVCVWICWAFDKCTYILLCFASIYLLILGLLGQLAFAMCIFEPWKDLWKQYISKYIEVSMWKVLAAIVAYAVGACKTMAIEVNISTLTDNILAGEEGTAMSLWLMRMIFSVAGILAFLSIPKIASTLLGIASGGSEGMSGGVQEVGKVVSGAASATKKTAQTAVKIFSGL